MPINFSLFHDPQYGGEGIADSWLQRANDCRYNGYGNFRQFDHFLYLWAAFNAWGICVTLAQSDASMIKQLKTDPDVREIFDRVVRSSRNLRNAIRSIEHNFPLPSFSDLLRLDAQYNWRGERNSTYWQKIAQANLPKIKVRLSPTLSHRNLSLADTLECMYMVRCNLVHGGKMANREEAEFVGVFSNVLDALLPNLLALK